MHKALYNSSKELHDSHIRSSSIYLIMVIVTVLAIES